MLAAAYTAEDDDVLLRHIVEKDEGAFEELYQRHSRPLFNYILRLVQNAPVAEDLLQDVFVVIWKDASRFRGQASVKTWLFRIAHHKAVSWLRKHREVVGEHESIAPASVDANPERHAIASWEADQVRNALDCLSVGQRAVLELAYYYDLPYSDIAKVVGCPVGTVKSRISYARRYLARILSASGLQESSIP